MNDMDHFQSKLQEIIQWFMCTYPQLILSFEVDDQCKVANVFVSGGIRNFS